jgi:NarL family two-component system response regulator YdfI
LIVEDHCLMVEAIRVTLSMADEFEIVGVADNGDAALELARRVKPDVVLLDLRLPGIDGLEILHELSRSNLDAKLIVLSACEEPEVVDLALRAGAGAEDVAGELAGDVDVEAGDLAGDGVAEAEQVAADVEPDDQPAAGADVGDGGGVPAASLTERELAVLRAVAEGMSNKEIAARMAYAEQTVKLDLTHVYRKLGVSSRTEAMAVAYRKGLIDGRVVDLAPTKA